MTTEQEARDTIRRVLGDTHPDVKEFPAGNLSVTVHVGRHAATIDGHPETGWGWTVDPGEDDGFSGHELTAPTLEAALQAIRDTVAP
ncbi:hypothetical protein OG204_01815 [Streptomyces sp. NBC_01387]|uniref:hypothetical protein n=1 Tax=unclassified Streptomyces TaxID=2593676 RepID=UPI002024577F|nr:MULTISPECIES: hypothetical protein [unclassified Streptomyces]MCX4552977.1 hypothetical protein [Streptomyces sp. NBC_01500]WSC24301.1 hypothetical protein OIE60_34025 [Streptomyces sp. NBC_01766]WSV58185.1 hypothetical protein OG282_33310 [Streptomyces sp. NBC_01014]